MTATLPATARVISQWLDQFETALKEGDIEQAARLFGDDSYWRDLIAFTWNIVTVEGPDGVRDLLAAAPWPGCSRSRVADDLGEPDRGRRGRRELDRVRDGGRPRASAICGCGTARPGPCSPPCTSSSGTRSRQATGAQGRRARRQPEPRRPGWRSARREAAELGHTVQPYTVIIGGGQGGIALGARLRQLGVPTIIVERNARAGRLLAQALQVAVPARPGLVRPPALHRLPEELAGVRAQGQDRATGSRCTPRSWSSTTGAPPSASSASYDEATRRVDRRRRARRRGDHAAPEATGAGHGHVRQGQLPDLRGHGRLPGRAAPLVAAPGPGRLPRQEGRGDRLQQLRPRHLRGAVGERAPT